jgi:multiple sugar transport system ATP-binding protein
MASVVLEGVSKRFGDVVAVQDLSVEIPDGGLLAIVGPSGCGKTTVLRLIAGLETPDRGQILIGGQSVNDVPPRDRDVAMVFEDYALYPHLAVRDNLAFALSVRRTPAEEIRRRVSAISTSMELGHLLGRRPPGLATGEAQHVAIGRAIVRETPSVFLLDDALSHLDARQRLEARAELSRLHRELGTTIVSVTHDQAEALAIGTLVAVMDAGSVAQVGEPRTLYERPDAVFVAGFIGTPPMNLIEMTIQEEEGRVVLRSGALMLPAPEAVTAAAIPALGRSVTVGIRPEHVRVSASAVGADTGCRGQCDLVEYMGHQVLVHVRVGEASLQALDDPARHVRVGDILGCSVLPDRIHLFDTRTGRALDLTAVRRGSAAAGRDARVRAM